MNILQVLASENYIAVNKDLIKILSLEGAVVFGELASEYIYWDKEGKLEDGYFYSTVENMQEKTSLSSYQQRQAIKILEENELISVTFKGMPAKRYIKINEEQVIKLFNSKMLKNLTTRCKKIEQQDVKKFNINKNIDNKKNKINNKEKNIKKESYGTYGRVKLTTDEYLRLVNEFSEDFIKEQIELLDEYIESNNNKNKYTNFNLVLRRAIRDNWFIKKEKKETFDEMLERKMKEDD